MTPRRPPPDSPYTRDASTPTHAAGPAVIVLHAALSGGHIRLWAEAAPPGGAPSPGRRERRGEASPWPFDAGTSALADAVEACPGGFRPDPGRIERVRGRFPTRGHRAVASSPLVAPPPGGRGAHGLRAWSVAAVRLDPEEALTFLAFLPTDDPGAPRAPAPGVAAAPDLRFCRDALRFALELVVRQRYLPGLDAEGEGASARWTPVLLDADAARAAELARAMPPSVRALEPADAGLGPDASPDQPPPPRRALEAFLATVVDHVVRASAWEDLAPPPAPGRLPESVDRRWASALTSADGAVDAPSRELAGLRRRVEGWRRSLEVAAGHPFRVCFRLEEPRAGPDAYPSGEEREGPGAPPPDASWRLDALLQGVRDPSLLLPLERGSTEFVLASLGEAAHVSPAVEGLLEEGGGDGAALSTAEAHAFLSGEAPALREAGYGLRLPAWWARGEVEPRLSARVSPADPVPGSGAFALEGLVRVEWEVMLGEDRISREELEALAALKVPLVRNRGRWIEVDPAAIRSLLKRMERTRDMTAGEALRMALPAGPAGAAGTGASADGWPPPDPGADPDAGPDAAGIVDVRAEGWMADLLDRLRDPASPREPVEQPRGLRGRLRPYQERGLSWLAFLRRWGLGACLADDMGLGKTVQTLALVQRDREAADPGHPAADAGAGSAPVLLVCPTSVLGNWLDEAARFTPDLPVLVHHGPDRPRGDALDEATAAHALVLTTYGILHRDAGALRRTAWAGVVLDEAQNIKNPDTLQARAARGLRAGYRVALTGTPVENHVGDLWSLMEFLNPGLLGSRAAFRRRFLLPIHARRDAGAAERLRRLTGPFVLRRLKTDPEVAPDLPPKVETRDYCTLTPEQATLYRAVLRDAEEALADAGDDIRRKGLVLSLLLRLKQVCNHPAHFLGDDSRLPGRSGKLARFTELLAEVMEEGERALVFTQFVEMGRMLQAHLEATFGREVLFLHGGLPRRRRDAMIARFQDSGDAERPAVFVLSLKAGGTGLNLTAANHVFHYDRWWNPAVEDQATDRAFRIGQHRSVQVHKLVCRGTLEERIDRLIEGKKATARAVVGAGEAWLTELDDRRLRELVALSDGAVAGEDA